MRNIFGSYISLYYYTQTSEKYGRGSSDMHELTHVFLLAFNHIFRVSLLLLAHLFVYRFFVIVYYVRVMMSNSPPPPPSVRFD